MTPAGEAKLLVAGLMDDASMETWCAQKTAIEQSDLLGAAARQLMGYAPASFEAMGQVRRLIDALAAQWPSNDQDHRACMGFLRWMYPDHVSASPIAVEALYRLPQLADDLASVMDKRATTTTASMPYKTLGEVLGVSASEEAIVWMWHKQWLREEEWMGVVRSMLTNQRGPMPLIVEVVRPLWGDQQLGNVFAKYGDANALQSIDVDWTWNHGWFLLQAHQMHNKNAITFLERQIDPLTMARAFFHELAPQRLFTVAEQMFQRLSTTDGRSVQLLALVNHHTMKNKWGKILKSPDHRGIWEHMRAIGHNKKLLEAVAGLVEQKSAGAVRKM